MDAFLAIINGWKLLTLLVLLSVDFLLGIANAIKEGTFAFNKIANFLSTSVLFYVAGYYLLGIATLVEPSWGPALIVAFSTIVASLGATIIVKIKKLLPFIPLPDSVNNLLVK